MKKLFLLSAILLAMIPIAISTNPPPNALFEFPSVSCDANGSVTINITHTGNHVKVDLISINATEKISNLTVSLVGIWYSEAGWLLENYTPNSLLDKSYLVFRSDVNLLGKGEYIFSMAWPTPRSPWMNKLKFAGSCPGKMCSKDDDCASTQRCVDDVCELEKAEETAKMECLFTSDCDDGRQCTEDLCVSNKCLRKPVKCLASIDPCVKGSCEEGIGCVYKGDDLCQLRQQAFFVRIWNLIRSVFS